MNKLKLRQSGFRSTDQRGMAAIVITMVTMVVISLIVIGFATISRREQRQSLDQLQSTQAFYAAESGVEDAAAIIKKQVASGLPVVAKDDCVNNNAGGNYPTNNQTKIDDTYDSAYTCLKVDPSPDSLLYDGVGSESIVVPLAAAQAITKVTVAWRPTTVPGGSPAADCPNNALNSFKPQSGANHWTCGFGVLRADLIPTGGSLVGGSLLNGMLTGFFVPVSINNLGQLPYANTHKANVVSASCTVDYTECKATITGISAGSNSVSLRLSSLYQSSNLSIQAFGASGTALDISGAQAIIDSTGRSADVLRRIQVRLPVIQTGGLLPGNALTSNGSICKRFNTSVNYFNIPGDITQPDDDATTGNAMCKAT